jgi:hypothetical protein
VLAFRRRLRGEVGEYLREVLSFALEHPDPVAVLARVAAQCAVQTWLKNTPLDLKPGQLFLSAKDATPTGIPAWDDFVTSVLHWDSHVPREVALGVLLRVAEWQEPLVTFHLAQMVETRFGGSSAPEFAVVAKIRDRAAQQLAAKNAGA